MGSATLAYKPIEMQHSLAHFTLLTLFSGLAIIAVMLRLWARRIQAKTFSCHDYLTVLGLMLALAETGITIYGCCYLDRKVMNEIPETTGLQFMFLSPILWTSAVTTIRAALIFLYISIFPLRSFSIPCYTVLVINVAFGASAIIANCLICRPISQRWGASTVGGSCGDQKALDLDIAVLNLLLDVVLVVLPMPILWGLPLAREKKASLTFMFGIGIMVCGITIYRVQATSKIHDPTNFHIQDTYCNIALLTSLEALLGTICACLPFYKPLLIKLQGSLPKRGKDQSQSFGSSGGIPIASRAPRLPYIKQYFNGLMSTTDASWCEKEIQIRHENQGLV